MYRKLYLNKSNSNQPTAAYILPVQIIENLYKAGVETFHEQPIAHICVPLTGKLLFLKENYKTTKYFEYWTALIERKALQYNRNVTPVSNVLPLTFRSNISKRSA